MQLKIDVMAAKLSHMTTPSAIHTKETYASTCQSTSNSSTQLTQVAILRQWSCNKAIIMASLRQSPHLLEV